MPLPFKYPLLFEDNAVRKGHTAYYLPTEEIKDYNVMIDGLNGCVLNYPYFKENYKLIALDLSKQHAVDAEPKVIK